MKTTTVMAHEAGYRPAAVHPGGDDFIALAAELGAEFAPRAAGHDRENTFVAENFERLRESGYLRLAIPEELGGLGATMRQVCFAQAELAKHCTRRPCGARSRLAVNNAQIRHRGNCRLRAHRTPGPGRRLSPAGRCWPAARPGDRPGR